MCRLNIEENNMENHKHYQPSEEMIEKIHGPNFDI